MSQFSQIKPAFKTKEDQIHEILREAILNCDLEPGEKLVIDQLSEQMGASTIPIRAAIQRLGMEGLVEIRSHSPAQVAEISPNMIQETFALLSALEQVAFEVAAEQAGSDQIGVLESLAKEMEAAITAGKLRLWAQKNIAFHRHIAEFTNMPLLVEFTLRTLDQWRRLNNFYFKDIAASRITYAQKEHWQILAQLKNKEVEALISLARQHNQAASENYQSLYQEEQEPA